MTVEYLKKLAAKGSREKFLKALSRIPDIEPDEQDQLN
jgi:hypothetical protein